VCQLTSPGVNRAIGTHILDFLDCQDKRLADTFSNPLAREHGLTRLEETVTDVDLCIQLLKRNKSYFEHAPFYIPKRYRFNSTNGICFVYV